MTEPRVVDPAVMEATMAELVGLVTGLQGEVLRLSQAQAQAQAAALEAYPAPPVNPEPVMAREIPNVQDEELLDRFVRGLKPRTRMEVTMRDPSTFDEAVKLADRMDSLFTPGFGLDRQPKGRFNSTNPIPILPRPANPVADPVPMEIDALRRRLPPLTDAERDRLRKIGGCFRCRQTGHIETNCPLNTQTPVQRPGVNHIDHQVPSTEHPDLIDLDSEPRSSENFTPQ
ncbi:hypothetical protein KFL_005690110 [Klebsormidium nitens]|uniref:CCHC-type domain-containing protein n=1 Tax=Klebsormidium nitens TaxID=105231 RepID=A0A1Y1IMN1_KLENI|nr:hypothetical protein KFL_005690110 [Klebsormidium nitens]|eukprot:GAQ89857.1 hypothetical protein KFL_005690110 [Klebsormidium nitens]